jgi:TRAP-type uncharacterized transport system substrate-binding protein
MDGPALVDRGEYDVCITTPLWYAAAAYHGKWRFERPLNVRAIASFPHDDQLLFLVREETGLRSLHDLRERRYPLRVSIPSSLMKHPAGVIAEEVLAEYGITLQDIEAWGGALLADRPANQNHPDSVPVDPSFDAVFDEAIMTRRWIKLTEQYNLRFLPVDDDVLARLAARGIPRRVLPAGRFRGQDEDVPGLDFSGWVMLARGDLPDEFTYYLARAVDRQKDAIHEVFPSPTAGLTGAVDLARSARELTLPLHPGAETYYREQGYL